MKNKITVLIILIVVLVLSFVLYTKYFTKDMKLTGESNTSATSTPVSTNITPPTFAWRYAKASSLNLDGQSKTDVFLDVTYPDGKTETKLIATADGGCNDLSDSNEDRVESSAIAQCYYAGLGYNLKIVKGAESYMVMQKSFEELSPGQTPVIDTYKVVSKFSFSNK